MKITQQTIDKANTIDCSDFYLGIAIICFAFVGKTAACVSTICAWMIYFFILRCNKTTERMLKR